MDDLWEEISINMKEQSFSLRNTDKEKRVVIQYVMIRQQRDLLDRFREKGVRVQIVGNTLNVMTNDALSEEERNKLLQKVMEILGEFISKFDVKKEKVRELVQESSCDKKEMSSAQAPKYTSNDRQAQSPVTSGEENHFFDPDPDDVCIFTVAKKPKGSMVKWLIPVGIGVATALAAPVVIPAAVGALGFGSGGIVGGSIAASMMSAAAVANGGGVAAGGLIATLQSIGATGVISASTALLSGSAAGAVSGVVVAATSKDNDK